MSKLERYPAYKESGVEWLGEIPDHWEIKRVKHLLKIHNGQDYKHVLSDEGYPVIGSGGQFAYANQYIHDGEVLLLGRKGTIDKPLYFKGKFWTVDTMFYGVPKKTCNLKFLYYSSLSIPFSFYSTSTALPSMTQFDLNNHKIVLPPKEEQTKIASFLDEKTSQIDKTISQKEKLIELLKERRQIVINEAVTKGLDKDVEFKDSGVEWIGEIPKHWEVKTIKALFEERKEMNKPIKTDNILSLCMYRGVIPYGEKGSGGNKAKEDLTAYKIAYPNDIVLNSMNVIAGSVGLSKYHGIVSPVYYMLYRRNQNDSIMFYNYIFRNQSFQKSLIRLGNGILIKKSESTGKLNTIRLKIPMIKLNREVLPYPPQNEQIQIAEFVKTQTTKIDKAIELQQNYIAKLKEYKASLIDNVVTGKVRVA